MMVGEFLVACFALIILSLFFFIVNRIVHKPVNNNMKRYVEKYYKETDDVDNQA